MSTTSSVTETGVIVGTRPPEAALPRRSWLTRLIAPLDAFAPTIARLGLGLVLFPHAAQLMLGWFGGPGYRRALYGFSVRMGMPVWLAATIIVTEFVASILLVLGLFTRLAALAWIVIMVGAILLVHLPNGFFMNWSGRQLGEGFEFHLLVITLALVCLLAGGGRFSLDGLLTRRRKRAPTRGELVTPAIKPAIPTPGTPVTPAAPPATSPV